MSDLISEAKKEASGLMKTMNELGVPCTRSLSLEIVAKNHGFNDWNRYLAHLKIRSQPAPLPGATVAPAIDLPVGANAILVGPPGCGKTRAMALYADTVLRTGRFPIWITFDEGQKPSDKVLSSLKFVPLDYNETGSLFSMESEWEFDASDLVGKKTICGYYFRLSALDLWRSGVGQPPARLNALMALVQKLSGVVKDQPKPVVLVDELHWSPHVLGDGLHWSPNSEAEQLFVRICRQLGIWSAAGQSVFSFQHYDERCESRAHLEHYLMVRRPDVRDLIPKLANNPVADIPLYDALTGTVDEAARYSFAMVMAQEVNRGV
jgi:hypothetical protein